MKPLAVPRLRFPVPDAAAFNVAVTKMPRFEFIAMWLVASTRTKYGRARVNGWQVVQKRDRWQVLSPAISRVTPAMVVYTTDDAGKLFDFARRTPLGHYTQDADQRRIDIFADVERARGG